MVLISNSPVMIKNLTLKGASTVISSIGSVLTEHPIEADETQIETLTASIGNEPKKFKVTAVFYDEVDEGVMQGPTPLGDPLTGIWLKKSRQSDYIYLVEIWQRRETFKFVCDFGSFTDCVMTLITAKETSGSKSTYEVEIEIQQLRLVKYKPTTFQFIVDADGNLKGMAENSSTGDNIYLTQPKKSSSDDRTIAQKGWDYMGEKRPGWFFDKKGDSTIGIF